MQELQAASSKVQTTETSIGLPIDSGRFRVQDNEEVRHLYEKKVIDAVLFKDSRVVKLGMVATKADGTKGVIVQLDDAKVIDSFIKVWWSSGDDFGEWCSIEWFKNHNARIAGFSFV